MAKGRVFAVLFCLSLTATIVAAVKFHSQLDQDQWVINDVYKGKRHGFFVDVGAADGVKFSNTLTLERDFDWDGICVEPTKQSDALHKTRKCMVEESVLASESGLLVDFMEEEVSDPEHNMYSGIVNHFDRSITHEGDVTGRVAKSLHEVLENHEAPSFIDYLSIDTEGSEYEILRLFPFDKYTFGAITVEHNLKEPQRTKIKELLTKNGYSKVRYVGHDDYYVHGEAAVVGSSNSFTSSCDPGESLDALWDFSASMSLPPEAAVKLSGRLHTVCSEATSVTQQVKVVSNKRDGDQIDFDVVLLSSTRSSDEL